ncbi:MAG TPA: TolC family protein, partial [Bacteroidetes bacterium]|nr:TolC family protein [Bacteroidota bacterium]
MWRKLSVFAAVLTIIGAFYSQGNAQPQTLSIRDCIQIALKNNPDLKNAERQIRLSATNVTMARANILPSIRLNFSSSRTYQASQGPYLQDVPVLDPVTGRVTGFMQQTTFRDSYYRNFFNNGVSLDQNIYDGGRWWNQIKQSNAQYKSTESSYKESRQQTIAAVTQRYYNLLKGIKLQEVYEKAVESAREQLKKTESMYEVGVVAQADVFRAKVSLGDQQINLIKQRNSVEVNRTSLNLAMGWEPKHTIRIREENFEIGNIDESLDKMWQISEGKNSELRSLKENVKSDEYGIKVSKSSFLPRLSVSTSYSRGQTDFDLLYNPTDKNYSLRGSLNLSWNLFNGFSDHAQVERASINYYIDKEHYISRKLTIKSEIEQSYLNMKAYEEIEKIN